MKRYDYRQNRSTAATQGAASLQRTATAIRMRLSPESDWLMLCQLPAGHRRQRRVERSRRAGGRRFYHGYSSRTTSSHRGSLNLGVRWEYQLHSRRCIPDSSWNPNKMDPATGGRRLRFRGELLVCTGANTRNVIPTSAAYRLCVSSINNWTVRGSYGTSLKRIVKTASPGTRWVGDERSGGRHLAVER